MDAAFREALRRFKADPTDDNALDLARLAVRLPVVQSTPNYDYYYLEESIKQPGDYRAFRIFRNKEGIPFDRLCSLVLADLKGYVDVNADGSTEWASPEWASSLH